MRHHRLPAERQHGTGTRAHRLQPRRVPGIAHACEQRRAPRLRHLARNRGRRCDARRHERSRASMPNGRAAFVPTGTNCTPVSSVMAAGIKPAGRAGKGAVRAPTCPSRAFRASIRLNGRSRPDRGARGARGAGLGLPGRRRPDDHARGDDPARDLIRLRRASRLPVKRGRSRGVAQPHQLIADAADT